MSDNIIEKIRKLMALADNAGTEEEAALAFEKAQQLMVKHAIEEAQLAGKPAEAIVTRVVPVRQRDEIRRAKHSLLDALARANRCQAVGVSDRGILIIGHETDAFFVEMLFASVLIQYARERTRAWKEYQSTTPEWSRQSRHLWVNSFAFAYAVRVGERLEEAAARNRDDQGESGALVLWDKANAVAAWCDDNMNIKTSMVRVHGHGRTAGAEAANRADLSGGRNNVGTRAGRAIGS